MYDLGRSCQAFQENKNIKKPRRKPDDKGRAANMKHIIKFGIKINFGIGVEKVTSTGFSFSKKKK